jgi:hypothetical protein
MVTITTADVDAYIAKRQADTITIRQATTDTAAVTKPVSNAEINRELTHPEARVHGGRAGGQAPDAAAHSALEGTERARGSSRLTRSEAICRYLPDPLADVARFAYITGWRIPSEVLPLEWRHVDFRGGHGPPGGLHDEERRAAGVSHDRGPANAPGAPRAFADAFKRHGVITTRVFFRAVRKRGGVGAPRPKAITSFVKAWKAACLQAGCPNASRTPAADGRPQSRPRRHPRTRGHVDDGTQDAVGLRAVQHRERRLSDRGRAPAQSRGWGQNGDNRPLHD